jgi:hypothetical protein
MTGVMITSLRLAGVFLFVAAWANAEAPTATANDPAKPVEDEYTEEVTVRGRADELVGVADSASQGATGREQLQNRPLLRAGELLETVPGVIITQHSGGGKANQYFLRGFNLDHGTDFRVSVGDIQVNMPSHGHGQGYSDLNFLIPELIDTVEWKKGPYYAEEGDFSAAGAVNIDYVRSLPRGLIELSGGSFDWSRALFARSWTAADGDLLLGLDASRYDGPWRRPDDFRKTNGLLRYSRGDSGAGFAITAMGYDGRWDATDQIPRRAVASGALDRFGLIDRTVGGESSRYSLAGERHWSAGSGGLTRLSAHAMHYELDLFSNFTYFLDDPEHGDQFEQLDERDVFGLRLDHRRAWSWSGHPVEASFGVQGRFDQIENGLFHTAARRRLSTVRSDEIDQLTGGPYADLSLRWSPWLRSRAGLRGEFYRAEVESDLPENSGSEEDFLLSPKLSLIFGPWRDSEVYVNYGWGFHSNDARGATIRVDPATGEPVDRVQPLVRAMGGDVGVRTQALPGLQSSITVFVLDIDSELVFVGDAGATDASRPSRRTGVEFANYWQARPWLAFDLDVAFSRGRFRDDAPEGDRIPGSIERVIAAGVSIDGLGGWEGGLRLRTFGPRPLIEDDSVRSDDSTLVNARAGYEFGNGSGGLRLTLEVFNLFDDKASDIDYFYTSRLRGEADEGVDDIHFHPAEKRSVRLLAGWRF